MTSSASSSDYVGKSLGLPQSGPGSLATLPRRIGAFATDWAAVVLISAAFFDYTWWSELIIFFVLQVVFIPTAGGSPGHRIWGLRVTRADGSWTGLWRPIVRAALTVIVIPAAIWDADNRGLHDLAAGTILVRAR
ncbi:RDD family protein [Microbacterium nanhaiense]|uniref:RDD family protein n=1 Tax=Microbacterium nanhaiense TaxID=1301026 RepID=A0ABQ2MXN1_9MICO|nr:RDD family protein [Microbacterium nanhaiense]GGO59945.1 RDD family protein [Microbacterium nanhaiense]